MPAMEELIGYSPDGPVSYDYTSIPGIIYIYRRRHASVIW